ncbi:hypothetical protein C8Q74DRAFT_651160 [Fomes fomentarius]|nr:hypothetical protein C8Q74DRAFT_651160 [Fomes fomentarius]
MHAQCAGSPHCSALSCWECVRLMRTISYREGHLTTVSLDGSCPPVRAYLCAVAPSVDGRPALFRISRKSVWMHTWIRAMHMYRSTLAGGLRSSWRVYRSVCKDTRPRWELLAGRKETDCALAILAMAVIEVDRPGVVTASVLETLAPAAAMSSTTISSAVGRASPTRGDFSMAHARRTEDGMRRVGTRSGLPYGACSSETSNSSNKARVPNLAQSQTSSSSILAPPPAPLYGSRWRWSPAGAKQCSMRGLGPDDRRPPRLTDINQYAVSSSTAHLSILNAQVVILSQPHFR